jgi:hypothetical protein
LLLKPFDSIKINQKKTTTKKSRYTLMNKCK